MRLLAAFFLAITAQAAVAPGSDCRALERRGKNSEARACFTKLARSADLAERAEGLWGLRDYENANIAFRQAAARDPKNPALKTRWGRLLLERFNPAEATDLFNEALEVDKDYAPALLGLALAASENFDRRALTLAKTAVEKAPDLIEARELLASLYLEDSDPGQAAEEALAAIKNSPEALDAMAVLAAADLLADRQTEWTGRMLAINPQYGEGFARIARHFVLNRRYEEAIAHYRRAVELDPGYHAAKSELGINLMRVGDETEARRWLEAAFQAGYRNKPTVNSLTLLDSYKNFVTFKSPRYVLRLHKKEAEVLKPYVEQQVARALDTYEKKYRFKLNGPVQVEMYPDHEDFAVRTMGMPGLGALGVTFGLSVAMDSPSARAPGSYHWASTLWHELGHVFTVTMTRHRLPRWFTEGLAVHEETATNPEWGDRLTPDILTAMKKKMLLPIATLDRGFIRPAYPAQIVVSYFQAGRVCDYIEQRWGWEKLLSMIQAFSQVVSTAEVIEKQLGLKPEQFDKDFLAWLEAEHAKALKGYEEWEAGRKKLLALLKAKDPAALELARSLKDLYPEYVEAGSMYEVLAGLYSQAGDKPAEEKILQEYVKAGGRSPALFKRLAELQEAAGRKADAEATLAKVLAIDPVRDEEVHRRLGDLRVALGKWDRAAEEYAAVVAMKPVDLAGAYFNLARALAGAGKREEAREQVLMALEAAPGYRPAQRLLLELTDGPSKKD